MYDRQVACGDAARNIAAYGTYVYIYVCEYIYIHYWLITGEVPLSQIFLSASRLRNEWVNKQKVTKKVFKEKKLQRFSVIELKHTKTHQKHPKTK